MLICRYGYLDMDIQIWICRYGYEYMDIEIQRYAYSRYGDMDMQTQRYRDTEVWIYVEVKRVGGESKTDESAPSTSIIAQWHRNR